MIKLYGLLGEKLGHSLSPAIHSMIFDAFDIEAYYHLFEIKPENIETAIKGLGALGASGVNVTIPYKVKVMSYLNDVSPEAGKIGAVNTIKFKDGYFQGFNTDYYGFGDMLKVNDVEIDNRSVVILGSGGAADAVLQYAEDNNAKEIIIVTRNLEISKLKYKSKNVNIIPYSQLNCLHNMDIIINCTPCGMFPETACSPVDENILVNYTAAVDLIYNPSKTLFLKHAEKNGLKIINGLYMLVSQAVFSQEIWNDIKIDEISRMQLCNDIIKKMNTGE